MKNMKKAMKLYMKLAYSPILAIMGLLFSTALIAAAAKEPAQRGTHDYASMLGSIIFGHIGVMLMVANVPFRTSQCKSLMAVPCAKELFTTVPVIAASFLGIIFDSISAAAAMLTWSEPIYDLIVINALGTVVITFIATSLGKKSRFSTLIFAVSYVVLFLSGVALPKVAFVRNGMIPDTASGPALCAAVTLAVYILGIAGTFLYARHWWSSSDRAPSPMMSANGNITVSNSN